jgi:ABC-type amino acid transport substrate-binding protein
VYIKLFLLISLFFISPLGAKNIKVSYDPDYAPFSFEIKGKPYGLLIDIWKLFGDKNNHTIEFIKAKDWDDAILLAKNKKVDFFLGTTPYEKWMYSSKT